MSLEQANENPPQRKIANQTCKYAFNVDKAHTYISNDQSPAPPSAHHSTCNNHFICTSPAVAAEVPAPDPYLKVLPVCSLAPQWFNAVLVTCNLAWECGHGVVGGHSCNPACISHCR